MKRWGVVDRPAKETRKEKSVKNFQNTIFIVQQEISNKVTVLVSRVEKRKWAALQGKLR